MNNSKNMVTKYVYKRKMCKIKILKKIYTKIISLSGADIPENVKIGNNVSFCHNCLGSVINSNTLIEDDVKIYQNVTIGKANPLDKGKIEIILKKGCILRHRLQNFSKR